ncbi:rubrerythrin [candidate division WOR-3 bacterium]|uniref:Rubrerythrin n=1 Tax=candidate division WOR-3 bacterium TaxID=2052148 RepID=A0A937XF75_UNCW3|nr:rubrerythrin [candidate division WOR-3 bacterium]
MTNPETIAALATALEAEKQSLHGYLRLAWETRDNSGKQMFIRLATDEFEHMRLLETWQAAKGPPPAIEPSAIERLVPRLSDKSLQIRGTRGQHQLDALLTALELERSARAFYEEQSGRAPAGPARDAFRRLAEMESAHHALIQTEIDYIRQDGFWFGLLEFTLESER